MPKGHRPDDDEGEEFDPLPIIFRKREPAVYLTLEQLCAKFALRPSTVARWLAAGKLAQPRRIARAWRWDERVVAEAVRRNRR